MINTRTSIRLGMFGALMLSSLHASGVGNVTESFDTTSQNWRASDGATDLTWISTDGPDGVGDAYAAVTNLSFVGATNTQLSIAVRGHSTYGSSGGAFAGNWYTSGVTVFSIDIRHDIGTDLPVGIRFASPFNFPGGIAVAPEPIPSGEWTRLSIPVDPANTAFVSFEGSNFSNVFSNVGNVQVLLYVPVGYGGLPGPYRLEIDNPSIRIAGSAPTDDATLNEPDYDRWMYPFNASSPQGNRASASTFGTLDPSFDQRDAQAYFGFVLTNAIPAGLGDGAYEILACRMTATAGDGDFDYDPSQDGWMTYLEATQAMYQADADTGRPIELFGAGFRGTNDAWGFGEDGPFADSAPPGVYKEIRNVYPITLRNGEPIDASNSVDPDGTATNGFDPVVFAIGTATLTAGDPVPVPTDFAFNVDVQHPWIQAYLQAALDAGILPFVLTSMHSAAFGGPASYPVWDQTESVVGTPATLEITYRIRPAIDYAENTAGTLAWSRDAAGAILETTDDLANPDWQPRTVVLTMNGDILETRMPGEDSSCYMRLRQ